MAPAAGSSESAWRAAMRDRRVSRLVLGVRQFDWRSRFGEALELRFAFLWIVLSAVIER